MLIISVIATFFLVYEENWLYFLAIAIGLVICIVLCVFSEYFTS